MPQAKKKNNPSPAPVSLDEIKATTAIWKALVGANTSVNVMLEALAAVSNNGVGPYGAIPFTTETLHKALSGVADQLCEVMSKETALFAIRAKSISTGRRHARG